MTISDTANTTRTRTTPGIVDLWCLGASPVFAIMAILTVAFNNQMPMSGTSTTFGLCSMPLMYMLMSAVHAAPWLRLIAKR